MKALSSAASITLHIAVGMAVLFGTARTVRSDPAGPREVPIVIATENPLHHFEGKGGLTVPDPIGLVPPDLHALPAPIAIPIGAVLQPGLSTAFSPLLSPGNRTNTGSGLLTEERAEVLSGPLPLYPELLRQAGVQGRIVLEAVVDTTGRVAAPSILVISATNPGFVAAARRALLATLFRPAMVGGKPVPMRVRIPYEFAIRHDVGESR